MQKKKVARNLSCTKNAECSIVQCLILPLFWSERSTIRTSSMQAALLKPTTELQEIYREEILLLFNFV